MRDAIPSTTESGSDRRRLLRLMHGTCEVIQSEPGDCCLVSSAILYVLLCRGEAPYSNCCWVLLIPPRERLHAQGLLPVSFYLLTEEGEEKHVGT